MRREDEPAACFVWRGTIVIVTQYGKVWQYRRGYNGDWEFRLMLKELEE